MAFCCCLWYLEWFCSHLRDIAAAVILTAGYILADFDIDGDGDVDVDVDVGVI